MERSRRRRRPEAAASHERWLVSYADFITLLFAFFTTLYAISTVDQQKAGKLVRSMSEALYGNFFPAGESGGSVPVVGDESGGEPGGREVRLLALAAEMRKLVETPELHGKMQVRVETRGVVLSLAEAGFFESGSAELRAGAQPALDEVARTLAARRDLEIAIEGHTDDRPVKGKRYGSNWELSTARATFVIAFLLQRGLDAARLSAAGYAEHRPVADNQTAEGRARNRRVDIVLQPRAQARTEAQRDEIPPLALPSYEDAPTE